MLLRRAHDQGSLIEGMALYASLLDGLLRIGLVLKRQLKSKTDSIDDSLIQQTQSGTFYTERQIYRMALQEGVIDEPIFQELSELYNRRNDIIHKFFLTSITYDSVAGDLVRYEGIFKQMYEIVYSIEKAQIDQGVGMTVAGSVEDRNEIFREINKKIIPSAADEAAVNPKSNHELLKNSLSMPAF